MASTSATTSPYVKTRGHRRLAKTKTTPAREPELVPNDSEKDRSVSDVAAITSKLDVIM